MDRFFIRHNAVVIAFAYFFLALNFVPPQTINRLLHVPSLMHRADSIPAIPPAPYSYHTSELDEVIPPLPEDEQAAVYKRGQ